MAGCAYCGSHSHPLTREHLFPKGIDSLLLEGGKRGQFFLTRSPDYFVEGAPTVRDVCRVCNNGALSKLDAYALGLLRQCNRYLSEGETIVLHYDYDLLLRWLLKMCFNSGESSRQPRRHVTSRARLYLGKSIIPKRCAVFLRLIHSYVPTNLERAARAEKGEQAEMLHHEGFRCSLILFPTSVKGEKVGRAITFKSLMFNVLMLTPKTSHAQFGQFCQDFLCTSPFAVRMLAQRNSVEASAKGFNTLQALHGHFALQGHAHGEPWRKFEERRSARP
jgi:hypothetical protein